MSPLRTPSSQVNGSPVGKGEGVAGDEGVVGEGVGGSSGSPGIGERGWQDIKERPRKRSTPLGSTPRTCGKDQLLFRQMTFLIGLLPATLRSTRSYTGSTGKARCSMHGQLEWWILSPAMVVELPVAFDNAIQHRQRRKSPLVRPIDEGLALNLTLSVLLYICSRTLRAISGSG